jgi:hypothetical protein
LYTTNYGMSDEPELLREAYREVPRINRNGITYSRVASSWGSGVSSDYIGFYFQVPPPLFGEVIIGVLNSWDAFAPTVTLRVRERDFDAKLSRQGREARTWYALLQGVVDSISMEVAPGTPVIDARYSFRTSAAADGYYLSTQPDMKLRLAPSGNAATFGRVMHRPCRIIAYGREETIGGVRGRWARVVPLHGSQVGWVFSGHLRKATDEEMKEYFEGL